MAESQNGKRSIGAVVVALGVAMLSFGAVTAEADTSMPSSQGQMVNEVPHAAGWKRDQDGLLEPKEYIMISTSGSITRALCPYSCADRMLEAKHCKAWRSLQDPTECYVQDTSIPSDAIQWGHPGSRSSTK